MSASSKALPDTLYLPDTLANWPWPRAMNPHYEEAKAASNAWFLSLKPFESKPKVQYAFEQCDTSYMAACAYPWLSKEHLRIGCDLMSLFFIIDEQTDVESAPVVRQMVNAILAAMENPHYPRPEGEYLVGEVARQFWERAIETASPASQKHMIESFTDYLNSVVHQAEDRDDDRYRTIDEYLQNRRQNIGVRPAFFPFELDLNLTDAVIYHPLIQELTVHISDLIILDNDILSYNKEQAIGDDRHNIVTLVMRQFNTDYDSAVSWIARRHAEVTAKFLDGVKRVPSFGLEMDPQLQQYIDGLGNWPRGNVCWSFECGRYFGGNKGQEYQKTRRVPLKAKVKR